jgi:hypothetical protein
VKRRAKPEAERSPGAQESANHNIYLKAARAQHLLSPPSDDVAAAPGRRPINGRDSLSPSARPLRSTTKSWALAGLSALSVGIGLHRGVVVAGVIGSEELVPVCHRNRNLLAVTRQDGFLAHAAVAFLQVSNASPLRMRSALREVR